MESISDRGKNPQVHVSNSSVMEDRMDFRRCLAKRYRLQMVIFPPINTLLAASPNKQILHRISCAPKKQDEITRFKKTAWSNE